MKNKILLVEDNELNLKLFKDILQYHNFIVDIARDGICGFEKISKDDCDLVILDIQLPKISGFEILEKLKAEKISHPKIIIVSACALDDDKKLAKKYNIETYITKPIDINNFIQTIKGILS